MYNKHFPLFIKGKVVTKEALEGLRDFPHALASIAFDHLSDGILFGLSIFFRRDTNIIAVSRGALKYNGRIILIPENELAINQYGTLLYIKLIVEKYCEKDGFEFCPIAFKLDQEDCKEGEFELGRFCLNENAVLRCEHDFFDDFRTPVNTLDITHCLFAGNGGATLHPNILKGFAKALLSTSSDMIDISFALLCINSSLIHKESIEWYIAKKVVGEYRAYHFEALYNKLAEILSNNAKKVNPTITISRNRPQIY